MKKNLFYNIIGLCAIAFALSACSKHDDDTAVTVNTDPNTGAVFSVAGDQVGRPGIATVFVTTADKDNFNVTIPSAMGAAYQTKFTTQLLALNSGYTTNILGLNASAFMGVLATDVLGVAVSGKTTYYDGTNVLTGRALGDDVIDVSLTLIFGGAAGTSNPGLTSDHVNANDKAFLAVFPYEATPW